MQGRAQLYNAMKADADFQMHENDAGFVFEESKLDSGLLRMAASLTTYLYDEVFVPSRFQVGDTVYSYKELKEELGRVNGGTLCPVCLRYPAGLKNAGQIDHFFPKAQYPALVFQPNNLALICLECNENTGKGRKDPMDGSDLTELYLPYVRGSEGEMDIVVGMGEESCHEVILQPKGNGAVARKRIENDDRLFQLTRRWGAWVEDCIEMSLADVENYGSAPEVETFLAEKAAEKKKNLADHPERLVEAACFTYLSGDGKAAFVREWELSRLDREKML